MKLGKRLTELKSLKKSNPKVNVLDYLKSSFIVNHLSKIEIKNILDLLDNKLCTFQELVDKFKNSPSREGSSYLYKMLKDEELFEELESKNLLTKADLKYLLSKIDKQSDVNCLDSNFVLFNLCIDNGLFQEIVDLHKSTQYLVQLFNNTRLFKNLLKNEQLNNTDLKCLLLASDYHSIVKGFCKSGLLLKKVLNEFMIDSEVVAHLNSYISRKRHSQVFDTIFDEIRYTRLNRTDEELLNLNSLNDQIYTSKNLNEQQRLDLIGMLKNNIAAQNKFSMLAYASELSYDQLKNYLSSERHSKSYKI